MTGTLVTVTAGLLVGCSGGSGPANQDGSASDALADGRGDATACMLSSDGGEPEVPGLETFDGGVPLGDLGRGLAVARCTYVGKCSSLAGYVVSECIQAATEAGGWSFADIEETSFGIVNMAMSWSNLSLVGADLLQAVAAGTIRYDGVRAASCLQELARQECRSELPVLRATSDCGGVFTCAADAGAPDAGGDAGAPIDGGACAALGPWDLGPPSSGETCTTAGDCNFVAPGAACDSDPPLLGASLNATPTGKHPAAICAPGFVCQGLSADGGLGTCVASQDVGGPCVEAYRGSGCMVGLVCACGSCRLAPTTGPCGAGDACKIGEAYCDVASGHCVPVKRIGDDCSQSGFASCPPSAMCRDTCRALL